MDSKVKSGKEVLDDFFNGISEIEGVDKLLAQSLANLYQQGKLTDINVKNTLQNLRENEADKS